MKYIEFSGKIINIKEILSIAKIDNQIKIVFSMNNVFSSQYKIIITFNKEGSRDKVFSKIEEFLVLDRGILKLKAGDFQVTKLEWAEQLV